VLDGVGGQRHAPAAFTRERRGTHCIGGGWAPESVLAGAESLVHNEVRSPDRPVCSKSLYQLHHRGPHCTISTQHLFICHKQNVSKASTTMDTWWCNAVVRLRHLIINSAILQLICRNGTTPSPTSDQIISQSPS
jgi:hypothetical protein